LLVTRAAIPRRIALDILAGGLIAGTLDIFVAAAINGLAPGTILQAIASGLLGKAAFHGGATTMVIGFLAQEAMSLIIAAIFILSAQRAAILVRRPLMAGALYGVAIFVVMNFVVVPLSAAWPRHRHASAEAIALNFAAMILFGLIVALAPRILRREFGRR
jgi:uncharacterized membrane protein YagU involved in acid resistance